MSVSRIALFSAILIYFIIIIQMLRYKKLDLKYTLLWLVFGCVMFILTVEPDLIVKFAVLMKFEIASNGLFAVGIFCIIVIMVFLTSVISALNGRIKSISQKLALTEERVRNLETECKERGKGNELDIDCRIM